ncbi:MAG: MFS transporter permease [Desulfobacterales bacterium]|jgi:hypothetical protein|nr:MFS transporter permease [Desulfobacteraceae bacterium]MBT7696741.1 MFS transporter permease [Desulfobacterales bacterium]
MDQMLPEIIIPKERAVFWLNGQGVWHNEFGRFAKKRIVDYFNRSIGKDEDGYFVSHIKEDAIEKVYFPYEETALFVFKVIIKEEVILVLNTQKQIKLDPENLYVKNDQLYMQKENEIVKFTERSMITTSRLFEDEPDRLVIEISGKRYQIPER